MLWEKQGLIFTPSGEQEWSRSHASVPCVDNEHQEGIWRIYFSTRDSQNRSYPSYIDVEAGNPKNLLHVNEQPILDLGELGTFDNCGVMPSWILTHQGRKYLYYIGWTQRASVPYHNSIGLAISDDQGQSFTRYAKGPLFSPTPLEPYFTGTSCVLIENGVWKNWYMSCTKWEMIDGKAEPFYHLKYAESLDGIKWERRGSVAIDYKAETEGGVVRASVLKENGEYQMWYSYRGSHRYREDVTQSYRIGFACSSDGINWQRRDEEAGIDISESGWDSQMIAYPHVVSYRGKKFLFYNGNTFGQSGIGYAQAGD